MAQTHVDTFTRLIQQQDERRYLRIPFVVAQGVESLTITYRYTRHRVMAAQPGMVCRPEVNIVDLALEDDRGNLVGASGSQRLDVTIHENWATPGYNPTPLTAGTWHILLGAYKIEAQGCPVEISISQQKKAPIWLRGDCHTHTEHSDGWYTVSEAIAHAAAHKLDFLFITDHNSMTSNPLIHSSPDLTVLPGVEITTYDGHCNLLGLTRPVKNTIADSAQGMLALLQEGKQAGALISVNHPRDTDCPWRYGFGDDVPLDILEVWNGPYTPANQQGIDLWQEQLCSGRILSAIGGSDTHHSELYRTYGTPTTCILSQSRSGSDILDALRHGRACISMTPDAPLIDLRMGDTRMGGIHHGPQTALSLSVSRLGAGDEITLLNEGGIIWQKTPGACQEFEATIEAEQSLFLRAEVRRALPWGLRTLAALSNPIYLR